MKNKISALADSITPRRFFGMLLGNVLIGTGSAILRLTLLGTDPFTGMNLGIAGFTGVSFIICQTILNLSLFTVQIIFGRDLIGIGTIVNALLLSVFVSGAYAILHYFTGDLTSFPVRLITLVPGLLVIGLGLGLYQDAHLGVAPYDAIPLMVCARFPRLPFFVCRVALDGVATLVCFLTGGVVGIGTLASAFGLGPIVNTFDRLFIRRLMAPETGDSAGPGSRRR